MRDRADAALAQTGQRLRVTLVTLGALADHGPRLAFTRNIFAAGGIDTQVVDAPGGGLDQLVCIVGSDAAYATDGVAAANVLAGGGRTVWLAGRPGELEAALAQAGVTRFVFMGCDVIECLAEALELTA